MKFKFCSDGDCPLWALAALHALSTLPAPVFRQVLQHILEEPNDDGIMSILKNTSLNSRDECARAAAVVRWVLHQAWRCGCPGSQVMRDLLVMGVPRAHATALAEVVDSSRETHVENAKTNGFMVNKVTDVALSPASEGSIDSVTMTLFTSDVFTGQNKKNDFLLERNQAKILLQELKKAHNKMVELEGVDNLNR